MNHSDEINELAMALSKAQAAYKQVKKSGKNPMFKSVYSTFDDMMTAVRKALADNGLAFSQMLDHLDGVPALTSMLMHSSGQYTTSTVPMIVLTGNRGTNEVQAFGSALTYMKRYAGGAMLGVGGDNDDDGNSAQPNVDFDAIEPIEPKGKPATPHWIEDEKVRKRFWTKYHGEGLSNDDIHDALDVASVKHFDGTMAKAAEKIAHWVENRALLDEIDGEE